MIRGVFYGRARHILIMFVVAVFFYLYGDHRDLHSFPTRRSSDLSHRSSRPRSQAGHLPQGMMKLETTRAPVLNPETPGPDRKSTRLNSSHVEISYAVFCLKKKNTIVEAYSTLRDRSHRRE